ncbi:molecular chaperone TorD family protein [Allochromatium humboldtianum]|uniref:Molecular chaperone TorD family protein n=1 Tax=Allochromatium humboldtianum TaxID=504901 RepID=A0A850RH43_9GAMM|nr:molecular chaperone TorD family protein [Allochromatium humboldtianum]NVZ10462.1 molecular chaperone TorD family protein [Allochromatium humboldtianum]
MQTHHQTATQSSRPVASDETIEERAALSGLYKLIARCLEEELDRETLRLLRGALREPLSAAGWTLDADFFATAEDTLLEVLAEEYTGLLVAPGCVNPHASVFETGALFREPCDRAAAAYREAGFDYRRRLSGEFPDHIGTLLGFLGHLAEAEAEALRRGDTEAAEQARQRYDRFLLEQLGPWAPGWCQRAARAALHPFYRQVLQFTEQLLWQALAEITDRRGLKELLAKNRREPQKLDYNADFRKASGL